MDVVIAAVQEGLSERKQEKEGDDEQHAKAETAAAADSTPKD